MKRTFSRLSTRRIERGGEGVLQSLALYRERLVEALERPDVFRRVTLSEAYVPLEFTYKKDNTDDIPQIINITELVSLFPRFIVLGPAGSGKTTALENLAINAAKGLVSEIPDFPVLYPLAIYDDQESIELELLRYINHKYHIRFGQVEFSKFLGSGLVILMFDGFDELDNRNNLKDKFQSKLISLVTQYPRLKIIITSRDHSWKNTHFTWPVAHIEPLNNETIRRFIVSRTRYETKNAGDKVDFLFSLISSDASLNNLAKSPLMLSLIVTLYINEQKLPRYKAELYKRFTDLIMHQWDAVRKIGRNHQIPASLKYSSLKEIAYLLQEKHRQNFTFNEFNDLFAERVGLVGVAPTELLLLELVDHHGIIVENTPNLFSFQHLGMQEYFSSLWLNDLSELPNSFYMSVFDVYWKTVVLLLAGMGRANELTEYILRQVANSNKRNIDHLLLAADCQGENPNPSQRITEPLIAMLQNAFVSSETFSAAIKISLALILLNQSVSTTYFKKLVESPNLPNYQKVAAAIALSNSGYQSRTIIDTLVDNLDSDDDQMQMELIAGIGKLKSDPSLIRALTKIYKVEESNEKKLAVLNSLNNLIETSDINSISLTLVIDLVKQGRLSKNQRISDLSSEIVERLNRYFST